MCAARAPGLRDDSTDASVEGAQIQSLGNARGEDIHGKETMPKGWEAGAALKG